MPRVFDTAFPLLAFAVFTVILIGVLFALALLGLAILGAAQANLNIGPLQ